MKKFWRLYWNCLHYLSYLYKPIHKNQLIKLINKMKTNGIKCSKCNNHFNEFTKNYIVEFTAYAYSFLCHKKNHLF